MRPALGKSRTWNARSRRWKHESPRETQRRNASGGRGRSGPDPVGPRRGSGHRASDGPKPIASFSPSWSSSPSSYRRCPRDDRRGRRRPRRSRGVCSDAPLCGHRPGRRRVPAGTSAPKAAPMTASRRKVFPEARRSRSSCPSCPSGVGIISVAEWLSRGRPRGEERCSGWKRRQATPHRPCRIEAPA